MLIAVLFVKKLLEKEKEIFWSWPKQLLLSAHMDFEIFYWRVNYP